MTLTVRSATVSGATTKGSALTHAELDENFNHLSQSSNHTFTPSGSAPISTTVQEYLRLKKFALGWVPTNLWAGILAGSNTTDLHDYLINAITDCAGSEITLTRGTWLTDVLDPSALFRFKLEDGATLKLKDSATLSGTILAPVIIRNSFCSVVGGTIDANRSGQDRAAFNTAGGADVRQYYGVYAVGTVGSRLFGVNVKTKVKNAMDFGFTATYCDESDFDVIVEDSGSGAAYNTVRYSRIAKLRCTGLDNNDAEIYPHALDLVDCEDVVGGAIQIVDQTGYDIASGNSLSDWFTGITMSRCKSVHLTGVKWSAYSDTTATKSVGLSMIGNEDCTINGLEIRRCTDVSLEMGGNVNCHINGFVIDGEYLKATTLFPAVFSTGIGIWNNAYYSGNTYRARKQNTNCTISNGTITRCVNEGITNRAGSGVTFHNVTSTGNRDGCLHLTSEVSSSFSSITDQDSLNCKYLGCDFIFNERYGLSDRGSTNLLVQGCTLNNNGQALTTAVAGTLRNGDSFAASSAYGFFSQTGSPSDLRTRTRLIGCITEDNQTNTTANGSAQPSAATTVSVDTPNLYHNGQTIKLVGCGAAGADLVVQITDIDKDELTIDTAISTFPLVAGSGTISTSGTTVTGSSTDFATEMQGRTWIKVGSDYRRIVRITSATAAVLESAFSPDLSGATFEMVQFDCRQIQCQTYGIGGADGSVDKFIATDHSFGVGNVTGNVDYGTSAEMVVAQIGSKFPMVLEPGAFVLHAGTPVVGTSASGGKRRMWRFDAAADEAIQTATFIPPGVSGKMRVRLLWTNVDANSGNVVWQAAYAFFADAADMDGNDTFADAVVVAAPAEDVLKITTLATITLTENSIFFLRILRDADNGSDTLANDAGIVAVMLEAV
jgi:hypothetical protein